MNLTDVQALVLHNKQISKKYYMLGLKTGWSDFTAGQFVMIKIPDVTVFLRRPFSICRKLDNGEIEICYKVVGKGTEKLKSVKAGQVLSVLGPQGNGFKVSKDIERLIIVAGGFGIAPFVKLEEQVSQMGIKCDLYVGGKSLEDILFLDYFNEKGVNLHITTEDGSIGEKGYVTKLVERDISKYPKNSLILCCGPKGLNETLLNLSVKYDITAQISYETYMACGIGVCQGCVVETKDGYKRACKDGPVFESSVLLSKTVH